MFIGSDVTVNTGMTVRYCFYNCLPKRQLCRNGRCMKTMSPLSCP